MGPDHRRAGGGPDRSAQGTLGRQDGADPEGGGEDAST
jgi:hypothetical protein